MQLSITKEQYNLYFKLVKMFRETMNLPISESIDDVNHELHDSLQFNKFAELIGTVDVTDRLRRIGDMMYLIMGRMVDSNVTYSEALIIGDRYISWLGYLSALTIKLTKGNEDAPIILFEAIHNSNMSKFCTKGELEITIAHYEARGISCSMEHSEYGLFILKVESDVPDLNLKEGTLLKSVNYQIANLSELVK